MTKPASPTALTDSIIFTGEAFVEKKALLMRDGKIVDLVPNGHLPEGYQALSCANQILSAGFIDCQVNGGGNVLLNNTPTAEGVLAIAAAHRKTGTTRLLPTCITDTPEVMAAAVRAVREARKSDTSVLGIHLEGPHLSEALSGAHEPALIRPLSNDDFTLYRAEEGEIFLLTLAPEQAAPEQIKRLVAQGVIVSLGHTQATFEQAQAAIDAGATSFTHILTRMPPIKTREPGIAVFALNDRNAYAGIIADGVHLHPELMRLALRAKANDRMYMVSDCLASAGADDPQPFMMGGQMVYPKETLCVNAQGTVSGSLLTLGQCVPVMIRDVRLDPERVLRMASTIPAQFLGLGDRLGKLLPHYAADVVALDHQFKAQSVWHDGVRVG